MSDYYMSRSENESDYFDDSEIEVNSESEYESEQITTDNKQRSILLDQQVSDLDTNYFYMTGNINYKYELEKTLLKPNDEGYFAIVRQDTRYKYWKRVIAIKNINYLRYLGEKFFESGNWSFHQIIYREQNLKFYFDIDWKGIPDINVIELKDFFEQLVAKQFQAFGVYPNQYVFDWQFNYIPNPNYNSGDADISTGCHLVVSGVKSNLSVIRFFAQKISDMARNTKYEGLLDLQVYTLGHTLRYEGCKFEEIPIEDRTGFENKRIKNVYSKPNDYSLVMITYTHSSDLFVKVPVIYQDEFISNIQDKKSFSVSEPIEKLEYYDDLIQDFAKTNNLQFSQLRDGKFKKLTYLDHICPCCGIHHDQNNSLYLIVGDNGDVSLNCFRNVKAVGRQLKPYISILKNNDPRSRLEQQVKSDIGKFTESTEELTSSYIEKALSIQHNDLKPTQKIYDNGVRNDIYITPQQLMDFFTNRKDLYLSSHLGTGKSKLIYRIVKDNRCKGSKVVLSSKCIYSADFASKFEFELYSDTKKPITVTSKTELVIQLESIVRLDTSHYKVDYLIIDELVSFLSHLQQSDIVDRQIYGLLVELIQTARQVIIGDAHLDKWYIDLIQEIRTLNNPNNLRRVTEPIILCNQYKPCNHIKARVNIGIPKQQKLVQQIVEQILTMCKLGIKTVLHTTRKGIGKQIFELLNKELPNQIIYITGSQDNDIRDWNDNNIERTHGEYKQWLFQNLDIVHKKMVFMHTQTLTYGVSFEKSPEYTQYIGIIDWKTSNGAQEACQALFRFRNIQNIQLYLTGQCRGQNKYTTYQQALEYVNSINYQGFALPTVDNKVFFLQLASLVAISKQQTNPNVKLLSYMLDLGITIEAVQLELDQLGTIVSSNDKPKNTDDLITVDDVNNFYNDSFQGVVDYDSFRNKKHTFYNVLKYRLFQPEIDFTSDPQMYVELLNNHIQEFCENYKKFDQLEKGIFQKIQTSDESITQMYQYLENVLSDKKEFYDAGIHQLDFIKELEKLNELQQYIPLIKLIEIDRPSTFVKEIVQICTKIGEFNKKFNHDLKKNQTIAIIKFVQTNTPFKAYKLINDSPVVFEQVKIKAKIIELSLDEICFQIDPLYIQTKIMYYKQSQIITGITRTVSYDELISSKAKEYQQDYQKDYQKNHKEQARMRIQKHRLLNKQ